MAHSDDCLPQAAEMSYDPYADVACGELVSHTQQQQQQQQQLQQPYQHQAFLQVVHHSGRVAWVPYEDGTSPSEIREAVSRQLGVADVQKLQMARATVLLDDTPVAHQCMSNDVLYLLPQAKQQPPQLHLQQHTQQQTITPLVPSVPSTPLTPSCSFSGYPPFSQGGTPLSIPASAPWAAQPLEEKLATAAANLLQLVSQSRQCTELQQELESAVSRGLDCTPVFQAVERHLQELIVHPSGNYLISKCFDLCPCLIDSATSIILGDVRSYALHKHGSYVVEAILTNTNATAQTKADLVLALLDPSNRAVVAAHDSGNFVLQKAIEYCPSDLVWHVQDAVQAVYHLSAHGPKMLKKLENRLSKIQQAQPQQQAQQAQQQPQQHGQPSLGTLPLPPSTAAFVEQQLSLPAQVPAAVQTQDEERRGRRGMFMTESWADAEDEPPSPPPMFTEGTGRVPHP